MKLSVVLSTHAAAFQAVAFKGDFEANVAKIASWGYDGVELAVRDPKLVNAGRLERVVADNGLIVPAIGTGQAWGEEGLSFTSDDPEVRDAAIDRIASHVPLAAHLDAIIILGLIRGITPEGQTHEQSMEYLVEAIQRCAAVAEGSRVRFALEPMNRYETDLIHTVRDGMDLIERVGKDNFGLLLDTFHMNIEEPDIGESIRSVRRPHLPLSRRRLESVVPGRRTPGFHEHSRRARIHGIQRIRFGRVHASSRCRHCG